MTSITVEILTATHFMHVTISDGRCQVTALDTEGRELCTGKVSDAVLTACNRLIAEVLKEAGE